MRCEIVRHADGLEGLAPAWATLWKSTRGRPATLHPAWALSWWRSFGGSSGGAGAYDGELLAVAAWQGADLVGLAPLFVAPPRGGALRARELKLVGDQLVGVGQAILAAPGEEGRVRDVVAEALAGETSWDLLDLTLAARPAGSRPPGLAGPGDAEALALRFAAMGRAVERIEARGRPSLDLAPPWDRLMAQAHLPLGDASLAPAWEPADLARGLDAIRRLLPVTPHGPEPARSSLVAFLEAMLPPLVEAGAAEVGVLVRPEGQVAAAVVVVSDGERRVEVVRVGDDQRASDRLASLAVRHALDEGAARYEFSGDAPALGHQTPGTRLRVFSRAAASVIERGYASIMRRAASITDTTIARVRRPIETIRELADVGPGAVTRVVARVATFSRLHLYRGELFVWRGTPPAPKFATIRLFGLADFDALAPEARQRFLERLDLVEGYCRQKWERGDLVVAAFHDADPVGILWCARGPVFVPDIGREVKPANGECYIHDVYVAPDVRGRAVAPAMLEFLARELRHRDVYRAWALIERSNTASTRAFEKASWASVADVIYARMGTTSRLLVRPPDPEARKFVGLLRG